MQNNEDFIKKAKLKEIGLELEKRNMNKAILFYENLLTNELFLNDYYLYKCLVILYGKTRDYRRQYKIIKSFFTSNIYCPHRFVLFFRNNLYGLIERKFTNEEEISDLIKYYNKNGLMNKDKSNFPVVIADMIDLSKKNPSTDENQYEWNQEYSEWKEIARGYRLIGEYQKSIETYEKMIYDMEYYSYKYYAALYSLYKKIGDYENALRIVNEYLEEGYKESDGGLKEFKIYEKEIKSLINGDSNSNHSKLEIIYPNEEESSEIYTNSENQFLCKSVDYEEEYDRVPEGDYFKDLNMDSLDNYDLFEVSVPLLEKYKADIKKPLVFYEYNKNLSYEENIQRKYYLKIYAFKLKENKRFDDYVYILEKFKDNSYFKNDWFPYKNLSTSYDIRNNYCASLKNIKELAERNIWLNKNNYYFFLKTFKDLEKRMNIEEGDKIDLLNYFDNQSHFNESESIKPKVHADKYFLGYRDTLSVYTNKRFEEKEREYEFLYYGLLLEADREYEQASFCYMDAINSEVNLLGIYRNFVYCLEILGEYEVMLDVLKHFCCYNKINKKNKKNRKFVNRKLDLINSYLGTNYKISDLIN